MNERIRRQHMTAALKAAPTSHGDVVATRMITLTRWMARGAAALRDLAPYAAIEIILPGGSLMALILWLYRRRKARAAHGRQSGMLGALLSVSR
jgi:hypothetical protein